MNCVIINNICLFTALSITHLPENLQTSQLLLEASESFSKLLRIPKLLEAATSRSCFAAAWENGEIMRNILESVGHF